MDQHMEEMQKEVMDILQKVWTKLHGLPHASPLELGAFFVLILFVVTFVMMILVPLICHFCCCFCGKPRYPATRVQPLQPLQPV